MVTWLVALALSANAAHGGGGAWCEFTRHRDAAMSHARIGTWNIKWFPDGVPGHAPAGEGTPIFKVACLIANTHADLLLLQEIKGGTHADRARAQLETHLSRYTKTAWKSVGTSCHRRGKQNLVLLYRADRVRVSHVRAHGEVDPTLRDTSDPCSGQLRAGLGAYVQLGDVSFHLLGVHLDSGREPRDYHHRVQSWHGIAAAKKERSKLVTDSDWVVLGDFNTMGVQESEPKNHRDETTLLQAAMAHHALQPVRSTLPCTHYYRGNAGILDHIFVGGALATHAQSATVHGPCADRHCRSEKQKSPFLEHVSDHCILTADIVTSPRY